jgi:hypothetical protein
MSLSLSQLTVVAPRAITIAAILKFIVFIIVIFNVWMIWKRET